MAVVHVYACTRTSACMYLQIMCWWVSECVCVCVCVCTYVSWHDQKGSCPWVCCVCVCVTMCVCVYVHKFMRWKRWYSTSGQCWEKKWHIYTHTPHTSTSAYIHVNTRAFPLGKSTCLPKLRRLYMHTSTRCEENCAGIQTYIHATQRLLRIIMYSWAVWLSENVTILAKNLTPTLLLADDSWKINY